MIYSTADLPNFVRDFLQPDSFRSMRLERIAPGIWSLYSTETDKAIRVKAGRAAAARERIVDFVSRAAPKTDRRRATWFYT